tara:strand:+ start:1688 stop:1897 length:210 start_codon:yes stop_codon:yes gene_type:complete
MLAMAIRFLPEEQRNLIHFILRMYRKLETYEDEKDVSDYCVQMMKDGKIGTTEWARFGKKLGVFRYGKA